MCLKLANADFEIENTEDIERIFQEANSDFFCPFSLLGLGRPFYRAL
jgi:hypothetical protein